MCVCVCVCVCDHMCTYMYNVMCKCMSCVHRLSLETEADDNTLTFTCPASSLIEDEVNVDHVTHNSYMYMYILYAVHSSSVTCTYIIHSVYRAGTGPQI